MPVTLVLNSYHFLGDVFPSILQELADDEEPDGQLFKVIRDNGHHILVTERGARVSIRREYENEAVKMGRGPQLVVVFDQLKTQGVVINANVPRRQISNLGGHHRVFIEDGVAAGVDYFVTEYQPWLQLDRNRQICPNLRIVNARQFVRAARAADP